MQIRKHAPIVAVAWVVTTALGLAWALSFSFFPSPAAKEARVIDGAMTFMTALAVPIFALVVVVLVYSALRFRQPGEPTEDGPPIHGNLKLESTWVMVTLGLVLFLAAYGSFGLMELRHNAAHAENTLVVAVEGNRWFWKFHLPQYNVRTTNELVLPVGRSVRFDVTAVDVVHSFWVPAFRVKIDAVPGLVTTVSATPDRVGSYDTDVNFRLQCAELCGLGHGMMVAPVNVVEPSQFEAWVASKTQSR